MKLRSVHSIERLEQLLMLRILSGEFADGELPSHRMLSEEYGLSRQTISAAVGRLAARGLCTALPGVGTAVLPLIQALDHKLLLELIRQAEDLAKAMQVMEQLLVVVKQLLTEASAQAAERRLETHVQSLRDFTLSVESRADTQSDARRVTTRDEYDLWRIVAGAAQNIGTTTALNALQALWLDGSILKVAVEADVASVERLVNAISTKDSERARHAAADVLASRERAVRLALPTPESHSNSATA